MSHWTYDNDDGERIRVSEREILLEHFGYWSAVMKKHGFFHRICQEKCIEDWAALYNAQKVGGNGTGNGLQNQR